MKKTKGTKTGKLRICSYHQTYKSKLKDLIETKKADEVLIKHYTFVLKDRDSIIAERDEKIAEAEKEKAEFLIEAVKAPKEIIQLNRHLAETQEKIESLKSAKTNRKQRIKRTKSLRERLAALQQKCEANGIDIEKEIENLNKFNEAEKKEAK